MEEVEERSLSPSWRAPKYTVGFVLQRQNIIITSKDTGDRRARTLWKRVRNP